MQLLYHGNGETSKLGEGGQRAVNRAGFGGGAWASVASKYGRLTHDGIPLEKWWSSCISQSAPVENAVSVVGTR